MFASKELSRETCEKIDRFFELDFRTIAEDNIFYLKFSAFKKYLTFSELSYRSNYVKGLCSTLKIKNFNWRHVDRFNRYERTIYNTFTILKSGLIKFK